MASHNRSRSKTQVVRDKRQLRKLRDSGLFKGRIDLRKASSKSAKRAIIKFGDVLSGKAAAVRPANPKDYSDRFEVIGKTVIIPKRKGEKIGISKTGKITRIRKVGKRTVKSTITSVKPERGIPRPSPGKQVVYRVPFKRGRGPEQVVDWRRFSYDGLIKFFSEYLTDMSKFDDWAKFIEVEELDATYERELDRYMTGSVSHEEPSLALPTVAKAAKRKLRRGMKAEIQEE